MPENGLLTDTPAHLVAELISIDAVRLTANINVKLGVHQQALSDLVYRSGPHHMDYRKITAQLIIGDRTIDLPLKPLGLDTEVVIRSVELPMYANPSRYPNDWYRISMGEVLIALPDAFSTNKLPFIPTSVALIAAPSMEGKSIDFTIEKPLLTRNFAEVRSNQIEDVEIVIKRVPVARWFIWTMALTPSLLLLVILLQSISRVSQRRQIDAGRGKERFVPLELAVAVLALLPLRQVLVAAEIQGLTTVDFLLGTQLAAFIAVVALNYAIRTSR
jgi:hypothetical protein